MTLEVWVTGGMTLEVCMTLEVYAEGRNTLRVGGGSSTRKLMYYFDRSSL